MNRQGFIGGSDCVKIMQGHWLELWQIKTGQRESEDLSDNIAVQLGVYTEDFNLTWFEKNYWGKYQRLKVINKQLELEAKIGGVPVKGTIDGMVPIYLKGNQLSGPHIIEAKHTNSYNTMEGVIEYYMPQVQTYIQLADADGCYLSVIFGNSKWESAYVARNDEYFNSMWAVVSDFWGYVVRGEEPVGVDTPTLSIDRIEVDQMVKRDASQDNAFISSAHDYLANEQAAKAFESAKKDLKDMVGSNEREVYCDLLTIKRDKRGALRITTRDKQ
jgi:predicted phage-related endonuclease